MTRARRIDCHCGCGAWFYWTRTKGRPRLYIDRVHYLRERNRVRNHKRLVERNKVVAP